MDGQERESTNKPREFVEMQYNTLRTEILALKSRISYLQRLSISSIPLVLGASAKFDLDLVLIVSPIVIIVVALMLLFEQNSIMRAGRYLKDFVEPFLKPEGFTAWEEYLERFPENRRAEKFFAASVHIAIVLYYLLGTYLAYVKIAACYPNTSYATWIVALYLGGLIPAVILILRTFQISTSIRYEDQQPPRPEPPSQRRS